MSTKEIISIMKDGGLKIVNEAKLKWMDPNYYKGFSEEERRNHIKRWERIDKRIRELAIEMNRLF